MSALDPLISTLWKLHTFPYALLTMREHRPCLDEFLKATAHAQNTQIPTGCGVSIVRCNTRSPQYHSSCVITCTSKIKVSVLHLST